MSERYLIDLGPDRAEILLSDDERHEVYRHVGDDDDGPIILPQRTWGYEITVWDGGMRFYEGGSEYYFQSAEAAEAAARARYAEEWTSDQRRAYVESRRPSHERSNAGQ